MMRFSDIGEQLPVPPVVKSKYQRLYPGIYDFCISGYDGSRAFKRRVVNALNLMLYYLINDGDVPYGWDLIMRGDGIDQVVPQDELSYRLDGLYLSMDDIEWDVDIADHGDSVETGPSVDAGAASADAVNGGPSADAVKDPADGTRAYIPEFTDRHFMETGMAEYVPGIDGVAGSDPTPKEDLFITFPKYPRVGDPDPGHPNVRSSIPEVPRRQSEISLTTDVNRMSDADLMNLYPRQFIRTRSPSMYMPRDGITMDAAYGLLIPVDGFTDAEVRDCIIRYPHIFRLKRMVDGIPENFYSKIEIDGELVPTLEVWKYLPESKRISIDGMASVDEQLEFIKEYAIRRYLLERDIKGIRHKYPVMGDIGEYMTLFMPPSMYMRETGEDAISLARKCVVSRSRYILTRNPRVGRSVPVDDCAFSAFCTSGVCDRSCPTWAQFSYLLSRNGLNLDSRVFRIGDKPLDKYTKMYHSAHTGLNVITTGGDEILLADTMTYIAVCNHWRGNVGRSDAYHLYFSSYIDSLQKSWNGNDDEDRSLYMKKWASEAKVLIISDMAYVNFRDFQSQTLLQLIYDREKRDLSTFVVCPKVDRLVGNGGMFQILKTKLKRNIMASMAG